MISCEYHIITYKIISIMIALLMIVKLNSHVAGQQSYSSIDVELLTLFYTRKYVLFIFRCIELSNVQLCMVNHINKTCNVARYKYLL